MLAAAVRGEKRGSDHLAAGQCGLHASLSRVKSHCVFQGRAIWRRPLAWTPTLDLSELRLRKQQDCFFFSILKATFITRVNLLKVLFSFVSAFLKPGPAERTATVLSKRQVYPDVQLECS